ncbi:MAG: hypothetical protein PF517_19205 [Salinivirgaceae bacterium]|jgi:hypothetical protein|nr:hypothetical protein [Salinivirgaceae bacterium]
MAASKPKVIKNYDKLDKAQEEQLKLIYPEGFSEFLFEFTNHKGELVSALPFETEDKIYMIRMSRTKADEIVSLDDDFDDEGMLKLHIKEEYQEKHADVDYLSDNENYEE